MRELGATSQSGAASTALASKPRLQVRFLPRLATFKVVAKVAQLLYKNAVSDLRCFNSEIANLCRVDIARHGLTEL